MFLLLAWTGSRTNSPSAGDVRHHDAHVTSLYWSHSLKRECPRNLRHWQNDHFKCCSDENFVKMTTCPFQCCGSYLTKGVNLTRTNTDIWFIPEINNTRYTHTHRVSLLVMQRIYYISRYTFGHTCRHSNTSVNRHTQDQNRIGMGRRQLPHPN